VHRAGVGILMNQEASKALVEVKPISDRMMTARFKTATGYMTVCQVYAPTSSASDIKMVAFYDQLQGELSRVPSSESHMCNGRLQCKNQGIQFW